MKDKIALCFLTYNNLSQPKLWKNFINSKYNIYIHNKDKFTGFFEKYCINNKVKTKWGHISLVKATLKLFEEAFQQEENKYFVLLSDKCIPLYSANKIYNNIKNLDNNLILSYNLNRERYNSLADKFFFNENTFMKQNQWMVLKRDTVQHFIENDYTHIFGNNFLCPDEHYFINIINKFNISFINKKITYVNWSEKSDSKKYREKPKTYSKLTNDNIVNILKSDVFFMRKVCPECNIPIELILGYQNLDLILSEIGIDKNKVFWIPNDGNAGDSLISLGTMHFFEKNTYNYKIIDTHNNNNTLPEKGCTILLGGGGNMIPEWGRMKSLVKKLQNDYKLIVLPHTVRDIDYLKQYNKNVYIIAREYKSYDICKKYHKFPENIFHSYDMAFYIDLKKIKLIKNNLSNKKTQYCLRTDKEKTSIKIPKSNIDISGKFCYGPNCANVKTVTKSTIGFLNFINNQSEIVTNRLHVSIGCYLMNTKCILHDNSYGKNKDVFNYILHYDKNITFV